MLSASNRANQMSKLMVNSLVLALALVFNNWNNHPLTTANSYSKTRLIHIPYINCINLVFSLCTLKSSEELVNIFSLHGTLLFRLNWLFFNNFVLRMGFKPARRPMFADRRWWTVKIVASCKNLVDSLGNCFVMKGYADAIEAFNIPA